MHSGRGRGPIPAPCSTASCSCPSRGTPSRERCREADIPDDVHLPAQVANRPGIARPRRKNAQWLWPRFDWLLTFDEGYGGKPGFLQVLDLAGRTTMSGKVPKTILLPTGWKANRLGRRGASVRPTRGEEAGGLRSFPLRARQTGPEAVWQAKVVDVALGNDRRPRHRLILARTRESGEREILRHERRVSDRGAARAPAAAGVHAAGTWNTCSGWRKAKSAWHRTSRGKGYVSLKRHLALCSWWSWPSSRCTRCGCGEKCGGHSGTGLHRPWCLVCRRYLNRRRRTSETACLAGPAPIPINAANAAGATVAAEAAKENSGRFAAAVVLVGEALEGEMSDTTLAGATKLVAEQAAD